MFKEIIVFLLLNMAMIFSSHLSAFRYFREARLSEQLITTFLIYVTQVNATILFLGVVIKDLDILYITLLNGFISFVVIVALRKDIKTSLSLSFKKVSGFSKEVIKSRDYFLYLFLLLFAGQLAVTLAKIYYLPPHVYDVFTYHLHPVVEWFQRGAIPFHIDSPVFRVNGNPLGAKFFHLWFTAFWGNTVWIELPQYLYGIFLSLVSYAILLKLNVQRNSALRYAIVIYFIPAVLLQSRSCQDHLILAACTMLSLFYFVEVFYEGKNNRLIFLALSVSLLFGIKRHSALVIFMLFMALLMSKGFNGNAVPTFIRENKKRLFASIAVIIILCCYFFFKSPRLYKNYLLRQPKVLFLKFLLPLAVILGMVTIIAWIYKKIMLRRAPSLMEKRRGKYILWALGIIMVFAAGLWVTTSSLDRETLDDHSRLVSGRRLSIRHVQKMGKFTANVLSFPYRITDSQSSYNADLFKISGFGIQFFVFGLLAYILVLPLCIFKKKYRNGIVGFLVLFAVLLISGYFFYYYTFFSYRLYIFFPVTGLILWAFILTQLNIKNYFLIYLDVLILGMLVFNGAACFYEGHTDAYKWKTSFTLTNSSDRSTVKHSSLIKGSAWEFIDKYIPGDQAMGYYGGVDSWIFPYFDNGLKRKIFYIAKLPGFRVQRQNSRRILIITGAFKKSLKERNIHFIHINPQGTKPKNRLNIRGIGSNKDIYKVTADLYYVKW